MDAESSANNIFNAAAIINFQCGQERNYHGQTDPRYACPYYNTEQAAIGPVAGDSRAAVIPPTPGPGNILQRKMEACFPIPRPVGYPYHSCPGTGIQAIAKRAVLQERPQK